ncbi:MAG TPA: AbrB/MazE/SpoVT family DNA-binding domain-containing protein, partial [Gemmatirosa sp.]
AIREALGVRPGDRVTFRQDHDGRVIVEAATVDLRSLRGMIRTDVRGVTLEDMEAAIEAGALASAGFRAATPATARREDASRPRRGRTPRPAR